MQRSDRVDGFVGGLETVRAKCAVPLTRGISKLRDFSYDHDLDGRALRDVPGLEFPGLALFSIIAGLFIAG